MTRQFAFGENWTNFSLLIDNARVAAARQDLLKLVSAEAWHGASFLDIGCGSGLSSLAAGRLGVLRIHAIDIDPKCVVTIQSLLASAADLRTRWNAEVMDAFDLDAGRHGRFDIVHSWGVLHDVHDWLGGFPYETASANEVDEFLVALGFAAERVFARPTSLGLFGSDCNEYVYRRIG